MSYRLLRVTSLVSAVVLSGALGVACDSRNEGGAADGRTNANVSQPAGGGAQATKASDAAGGGTPLSTGPQRIEMGDDVFLPPMLTVATGTKVTWVNKGHKAHTVVSNEKLFDSGLVNVDGEFSHTFDAPGEYLYHCAPHAKMVGRIVVR